MSKSERKGFVPEVGRGDQVIVFESGLLATVKTFIMSTEGVKVVAVLDDGSELHLKREDFNKTWSGV